MFITLEGGEGAGKSTVVQHIRQYCQDNAIASCITKEPGGSILGEKLRPILLNQDNKAMSPLSELFLYLADRAYHVEHCIQPALAKGLLVISDRYVDSTLAYQGYARNIAKEDIIYLNALATGNLLPQCTFILDIDPEIGLARTRKRSLSDTTSAKEARFEMENIQFHQTLRLAYLEIAKSHPRFVVIDASRSVEEVRLEIINKIQSLLA